MMDLELRLSALRNLVPVKTDEVEQRLLAELTRVEGVLQNGVDYDELSAALKALAVLAPRFHARVIPMLSDFVRSVLNRTLEQGGESIPTSWIKYRSASHLVREAIDVPHAVRFVHTAPLLDFLLDLWKLDDEEVQNKAARMLEAIAEFDLNLFYGQQGLGARPQAEIVAYFGAFDDQSLVMHADIILKMLRKVLSPSIEGHTWNYNSMTISRSGVRASSGIADMRRSAIFLLKRMYALDDNVSYRKRLLSTLGEATRREQPSNDAETAAMFDRDAVDILDFLRCQIPSEQLPLVQAIEHDAYWNYYHAASNVISEAAIHVRDSIEARGDYQIYKQLIGFEGIHGSWEELKRSEAAWEYGDDKRLRAAEQYVDGINDDNHIVWRDRILEFSKTRSDDLATFPVYYEFLKSVGQKRPDLALELVQDHQEVMEPFLIALLRGLWSSERNAEVEAIAQQWLTNQTHLADLAKSLNVDYRPRFDLLIKVISEADRVGDTIAIIHAMGVAARQYALGHTEAKSVFMQGLREVAKREDARWANVIWFNRDFAKLIESMQPAERAEIMASMTPLTKIDYQAEEILYAIGRSDPPALVSFLMTRIREEHIRDEQRREAATDEEKGFEAIPDSLHKLNKVLVEMPGPLLSEIRANFDAGSSSMFPYSSSARLVMAVFPAFEKPLQDQLLTYIRTGGTEDIEFAIAILRAYGGTAPILPLCKEIIKAVPEKSNAWKGIAASFQSTGVVSGEYGMVNAFEAKRVEISSWLEDDNAKVRAFAEWLTENLSHLIVQERQRADEDLALRKHRYGIGTNDT
ncbi:hypothetical protein [Lysobacter sp. Root690]|uniref:hypothetical protein n=1 Tax=Lysobacter sp. Root690 TaxID=1736588 RepID=UPI0006FC2B0D|nr:hypothetical protein [Lysobacter sp. Root690]KRB11146.1 hypothetical protein ASD86_01515 [Lysobacter sp. Root690]